MGGDCAMDAWARLDPPLAQSDHVHLRTEGYRRTADALLADLLVWVRPLPAPTHAVPDTRLSVVLHRRRRRHGGVARPSRGGKTFPGGGELRLLRAMELALLPAAGVHFSHGVGGRPRDWRGAPRKNAALDRRRRDCGPARAARLFQIFRLPVGGANAAAAAAGVGWRLPFVEVILPVGISFVTFHGISYIVDVRRGDADVCRRLSDIMLYLSFFPQLVAGPIVRAAAFLPQLAAPPAIRPPIAPAVTLILGGLFKKVVLANYLATDLVDPVVSPPHPVRDRRSVARDLCLRGADLLRFLRLQRNR